MSQPKGYVDTAYLETTASLLQKAKERSYAFMHIQPGHRVLDVGCGPGTDTLALGQIVGPGGQVSGVDYDQEMVSEADQRAADSGAAAWVRHHQADATALPWQANRFDACRSERLFQHLCQPEKALSEMVRVIKPGGRVVVLDTDWGSLSIDTAETDIERRLARVKAERCLNNGYSGRQLYRFFRCQDLEDLAVEMVPVFITKYAMARQIASLDQTEKEALAAGIINERELERWRVSLERADAEDVLFGSASLILVGGRKPFE